MTQTQGGPTTATLSIARRIKSLRRSRGWSADRLAAACAEAGMPGLNRSVLANIESGRRKYVSVDETLTLAWVLDVAPVHLMIPIDSDRDEYGASPEQAMPVHRARAWLRGEWCPPGTDERLYWSEVPRSEFSAGESAEYQRGLQHEVKAAQRRSETRNVQR